MQVGRVRSLARYPVKSMAGEPLEAVTVGPAGLRGDRRWAVYTADGGIGSGKTTRRFRRIEGLLAFRAGTDHDGTPLIATPDGGRLRAGGPGTDAALSALLGQPLRLAEETTVRHHDEAPVHLVTTASLRRLAELAGGEIEPARARANLVLDVRGTGWAEDAWSGRQLLVGDEVLLALGPGMPRCVMLDAPGGPPALRVLGREHGLSLGLQATVARAGTVRVGDAVRLLGAAAGTVEG